MLAHDRGAEDAILEEQPSPFAALYAHWERCHWSPLELDLRTDAATFASLEDEDRDGFAWMFANRFHAEFNVARLLAPFLLTAPASPTYAGGLTPTPSTRVRWSAKWWTTCSRSRPRCSVRRAAG